MQGARQPPSGRAISLGSFTGQGTSCSSSFVSKVLGANYKRTNNFLPVAHKFTMYTDRKQPLNPPVMRMRVWIRHVYCINIEIYTDRLSYSTVMGKDIDTPVRLERATSSEADTLDEECSSARLGQVERARQTQQQASTPEWSHLLVKSSCLPPWTWAPLFPLQ